MLKYLEGEACIAYRESAWRPKAPSEPFKASQKVVGPHLDEAYRKKKHT